MYGQCRFKVTSFIFGKPLSSRALKGHGKSDKGLKVQKNLRALIFFIALYFQVEVAITMEL